MFSAGPKRSTNWGPVVANLQGLCWQSRAQRWWNIFSLGHTRGVRESLTPAPSSMWVPGPGQGLSLISWGLLNFEQPSSIKLPCLWPQSVICVRIIVHVDGWFSSLFLELGISGKWKSKHFDPSLGLFVLTEYFHVGCLSSNIFL